MAFLPSLFRKNSKISALKGMVQMNEKTLAAKTKTFLMFAGPAVFVFIAVLIVPLVYGVYLTFTSWDGISNNKPFVGLNNYIEVFKDKEFWNSLVLTLKYVAVSVVFINLIAFILAFLVTSGIKGQNFLRAGFFTPNLIGGVVLGFIWRFVFARALVSFGTAFDIDIFSTSWLSDPQKAFWAMIIVTTWQYSGYMMLIYIAGLMGVPKDLTEAASIDGATGFQATRHVVLPMMVPSFVICLFLSITRCFMVYDLNLSLTEGGPFAATRMVAMHVYKKAFEAKQYGTGQAEALILFIIVAIIGITQITLGKRKEVEA
jgi:raffinose/stachyose/melibiose transport system permease protein